MSLSNLPSLSHNIHLGSEGGLEFSRLMNMLLSNEYGLRLLTFSDASGDYKGVDSILDDTIGYQYKFYPCPFSPKHKTKIKESLTNALDEFKDMMEWVLVTPDNMMKDDLEWFEQLLPEDKKHIKLRHLGHDKIVLMLEKIPAIGYRYYKDYFSNSFGESMLLPELEKLLEDAIDKIRNFKPRSAFDTLLIIKETALNQITDQKFLARLNYALGLANTEIKNIQESVDYFQEAYELNKNDHAIKIITAKALYYTKQPEKAKTLALEILNKNPTNKAAKAILFCLDETKHTEEGIRELPDDLLLSREFVVMLNNTFLISDKYFILDRILELYLESPDESPVIDFDTKGKWLVISHLLFSSAESEHPFLIVDDINRGLATSEKSRLANVYLRALVTALGSTEISQKIVYYRVLYHYGNFIMTESILEIEQIELLFPLLSKEQADVARLYAFKGYVQAAEHTKALKVAAEMHPEKYSNFLTIISTIQFNAGQIKEARASATHYIDQDGLRIDTSNIFFLFYYSTKILTVAEDRLSLFESLCQRNCFSDLLIQTYVKAHIAIDNSESKDNIFQILETVREQIQHTEENQKHIAASLYFRIGRYQEVINLLYNKISEEYESDFLECLIIALYETGQYPERLLFLLEKWRLHFKPRHNIARIEIEICEFLKDWKRAEVVAEYYKRSFPNEKKASLFQFLLIYHHTNQAVLEKDILLALSKETLTWSQTQSLIPPALKLKEFHLAVELIWQFAKSHDHTEAQQWFLSLIHNYGHNIPELEKEYSEGEEHLVVAFEYNGKSEQQIIHTTDPFLSLFIRKKTGEYIVRIDPIDSSFQRYTILGFQHRFAWLSGKIFEQFFNSANSGFKSFEVQDQTLATFEKRISEQFGYIEEQRREQQDAVLQNYYNNRESLTMVTLKCFEGNPIDSVYTLFQTSGYLFRTLPAKITAPFYNEHAKPVLDFYSLILLFDLSKDGIPIKGSFIVSSFIIGILEEELENLKIKKQPTMAIRISQNTVTPTLYDESFYKRRITLIEDILSWIKENCQTIILVNKLRFRNALEKGSGKESRYQQYIIDTAILASEEKHLLITDDSFLIKMFNHTGIIGAEAYLMQSVSTEWHQKITTSLIERKMIGVYVNEDALYDSYFGKLKGGNTFGTAIQNIRPDVCAETNAIIIAIKFAKKILLESFLPDSEKQRVITFVFQTYLTGLKSVVNAEAWSLLQIRHANQISQHFNLLPLQNRIVQICYADAINIINQNIH